MDTKNHLRLVASNDESPNGAMTEPPGLFRQRFFSIASAIWPTLRYTLFVVLVFLRIPINFVSRLIVGPLVFGWIAWGFIAGWTSTAALALGGAAFVFFLLGFAFDSLVLALAPEGYMMEL